MRRCYQLGQILSLKYYEKQGDKEDSLAAWSADYTIKIGAGFKNIFLLLSSMAKSKYSILFEVFSILIVVIILAGIFHLVVGKKREYFQNPSSAFTECLLTNHSVNQEGESEETQYVTPRSEETQYVAPGSEKTQYTAPRLEETQFVAPGSEEAEYICGPEEEYGSEQHEEEERYGPGQEEEEEEFAEEEEEEFAEKEEEEFAEEEEEFAEEEEEQYRPEEEEFAEEEEERRLTSQDDRIKDLCTQHHKIPHLPTSDLACINQSPQQQLYQQLRNYYVSVSQRITEICNNYTQRRYRLLQEEKYYPKSRDRVRQEIKQLEQQTLRQVEQLKDKLRKIRKRIRKIQNELVDLKQRCHRNNLYRRGEYECPSQACIFVKNGKKFCGYQEGGKIFKIPKTCCRNIPDTAQSCHYLTSNQEVIFDKSGYCSNGGGGGGGGGGEVNPVCPGCSWSTTDDVNYNDWINMCPTQKSMVLDNGPFNRVLYKHN